MLWCLQQAHVQMLQTSASRERRGVQPVNTVHGQA